MKKRSGFTLIEVMVLIVIVGILVALAVPKFKQMSRGNRESLCSTQNPEDYVFKGRGFNLLLRADSTVAISCSPDYSVRKITFTEYGERTDWIVCQIDFLDHHYRRGDNAYYIYNNFGQPVAFLKP